MSIVIESMNKNMFSGMNKNIIPMGCSPCENRVEDNEWWMKYEEPSVKEVVKGGSISKFREMIKTIQVEKREREDAAYEKIYDEWMTSRICDSWSEDEEEIVEEYWGDYSYNKVMALIDLHPKKETTPIIPPRPVKLLSDRTMQLAINRKLDRAEQSAKSVYPSVLTELKENFGITPEYIPTEYTWEKEIISCPICEDEINDASVSTPCCNTSFCAPCVKNNLAKTGKCPACFVTLNVSDLTKKNEITIPSDIKNEYSLKIDKDVSSSLVFVDKTHKKVKKSSPVKTEKKSVEIITLTEEEKENIKKMLEKNSVEEVKEDVQENDDITEQKEEEIVVDYSKTLSEDEKAYAAAFASRQAALQKKREQEKRQNAVLQQEQKQAKKEAKWQNIQKNATGKMRWTFEDFNQMEVIREQRKEVEKKEDVQVVCEERKAGYEKLANITEHADQLRKSAFCKSVFNKKFTCTFGNSCKFAHSISEWTPSVCFFGSACKFVSDKSKPCSHIHPNETKESVMKRCNISMPSADITIPVLPIPIQKVISVVENKTDVTADVKPAWNVVKTDKVSLVEITKTETPIISLESSKNETNVECVCEYEDRCKGFAKLSNTTEMEKIKSNNKGSKLCSLLLEKGKCYRKVCNFAHNLEEYNPIPCAFGNGCKMMQTCAHLHPSESKEYCAKRLGLKVQEVKKVETPKKCEDVKTWTAVETPKKCEDVKTWTAVETPKKCEENEDDGFVTVQNKKMKKEMNSPKYTKNSNTICKWVQQYGHCKYEHKDCDFAHNLHQYNPQPCSHFRTCRFMSRCKCIHHGETKEDVIRRLGIKNVL